MTAAASETLLIATSNQGKFREFQSLLPDELTLLSLNDLDLKLPPENGTTFAKIAATKALTAAKQTRYLTLADDSGLCVAVLDGAPGIRSARFAGDGASDAENRALLLERLNGIPPALRGASFICALALAGPNGLIAETTGECHGTIGTEEIGQHGFGYDPIFRLTDGRTFAELEPHEKHEASHRADACKQIIPLLNHYLQITPREGSR
ncbi:MAG: RdgB/HAM1 family non-canonical purine NTP pyrophosphatase [Chloroflexota bacterium]|nr:RdgB/HAM1 family non-canonical purine NTP pyrophosphatase [Chloroflexota bacterium]